MNAGTGNCLDEIKNRSEQLKSYSGLYQTNAQVYRPKGEDQLRCIFDFAKQEGRKVTLRAGAHAFDEQSLGDDIVVSMTEFNGIEVLPDGKQVRVGAGATWGAIVRELKGCDLVPFGTVTSSHATAGGTVAADCLSRFSPSFGKEAKWVQSFRLMTVDGAVLDCSRPAKDPPSTLEEKVFMAAVGGFGYLGALLDINFEVRPFKRAAVCTQVRKYDSFNTLARDLIPPTAEASPSENDDCSAPWEAVSAGLYAAGGNQPSAMIFNSKLTSTRKRRPFLLHHPYNPLRILAEWLMRVPFLAKIVSRCYFGLTRDGATYIDGLWGYLFFMDGNVLAKRIARWFGIDLKTVQQTFVVPVDLLAEGGLAVAQDRLTEWLERADQLFRQRQLTPTISDVLYLPKDLAFCLSPNPKRAGFAVSYVFETSAANTITNVKRAFEDLADVLSVNFDGRVSLVKNVDVKPATLRAMYRPEATEFLALKAQLDPAGVLCNRFFERVLGPCSTSASQPD